MSEWTRSVYQRSITAVLHTAQDLREPYQEQALAAIVRFIRLVSVASIENFLAKLAREQQGEDFSRRKSKDTVSSQESLSEQKARRGRPRKEVVAA